MKNYFQKKCLFAFLFLGILLGVSEMRAAETDYPSSAAAQTYSVTFSVNGVETTVTQSAAGAAIKLAEATPLSGYVLAGWSRTPIDAFETSSKQTIVVKGTEESFVPTQNEKLYAVFARNGKNTNEGELLIYANVNGTRYYMAAESLPIQGSNIPSTRNRNSAQPFMVTNSSSNQYNISYEVSGKRYYLSYDSKSKVFKPADSFSYDFYRVNGNNGDYQFVEKDNKNLSIMFRFVSDQNKYFNLFDKTVNYNGSTQYFDLNLESVYYTTHFTYDLTVSEAGYATLCLPFNATIPEGVQVFTARYDEGKVTLEECPNGKIRAGEGYIVKAVPGEYTFVATNEEVAAPAENSLVGVTETEKLHGDETIYIFAQQEGVIGFYRLVGDGNLDKNKAYLKISAPLGSRDTIHLL